MKIKFNSKSNPGARWWWKRQGLNFKISNREIKMFLWIHLFPFKVKQCAIQKRFLIIISGSLYKSFSINICVIDIYSYGYAGGEMFTFCCTKNLQLVEKCQFWIAEMVWNEGRSLRNISFKHFYYNCEEGWAKWEYFLTVFCTEIEYKSSWI